MVAGPQLLSAIFLATSEQWRRNSAAYLAGAALSISLVVAAVNVYRTRETAEPPAWMRKLTGADPRFAFRLGFLLLGLFPTDVLTSVAVGTTLSSEGAPLLDATVFALGERGEQLLPKARDWMTDNA